MYSMLVVDDEVRERNIVRLLFQQKYENQFYINEAGSGEETLKILEEGQADILIIDIQMPGMNGLETVKKIRETNKQIYIIILTAFNYFEYAKEAIEAGVNDFLLKPLIRDELKKAMDKFFQHYMEKNHHINSIEEQEAKELLSKELVSLLSFSSKDSHEIDRYINLLNIKEKIGYCAVFNPVETDSYSEVSRNYLKIISEHLETLLKEGRKRYIINKIGGKMVIFIFSNDLNEDGEEDWIQNLLKKTCRHVHIKISLGKGKAYPVGIRLHDSFMEALGQLNHTIVELNTKEYEKIVSKNIKEQNIQKATSIIKDLLMAMSTEKYDKIKFKTIEILTEVTKKTLDHEIREKLLDELSFIIQIEEMEHLIKFIEGYIKKIGKELESISNANRHYIVDQVVQYIKEHYSESLSVEELASQFYISSFYLSKLFKDNQKLCFTDYVTNYRINKAIELMEDASRNIKNIAYEVGYVDANYFSRVFKKKMGIGPREYRKNYIR
ncbi:MAG: response regulator [Clostridia bacterium]|nr:response regulator [Clostridia bacterium]